MPGPKTQSRAAKPARTNGPRILEGTVTPVDGTRAEILKQYEKAVVAIQSGDYAAAHPAFEALLKIAPMEFADRIRMYLAACIAQANKGDATFSSPEEKYDYAIALLNDGHFEDAREHLQEILQGDEDADYAFYGLAVLASMTGDAQSCLERLAVAIRLNSVNRIQARADSDFQGMADDPRFTELLYPEA